MELGGVRALRGGSAVGAGFTDQLRNSSCLLSATWKGSAGELRAGFMAWARAWKWKWKGAVGRGWEGGNSLGRANGR